jgi:ribokinase
MVHEGTTSTVSVVCHLSLDRIVGEGFVEGESLGGSALYTGLAASVLADRPEIVTTVCEDFPMDELSRTVGETVSLDSIDVLGEQRRSVIDSDVDVDDRDRISPSHSDETWIRRSEVQAPRHVPERSGDIEAVHLSAMMPRYQRLSAEWAADRGATTTLGVSEFYVANHAAERLGLLEHVDVFLPSDVEVRHIYPEYERQPEELATIAGFGPDVVVRHGEEGCVAYDDRDESMWNCSALDTDVVDPTGAGDSFNGGFVSVFRRDNLVESCRVGVALATLCIKGRGPGRLNTSTRTQVERLAESVDVEPVM